MPRKATDEVDPISALHDFVTGKVFDVEPAPTTKEPTHADESDADEADDEDATAQRARAKRKNGLPIRPSNAAGKRPAKRSDDAAAAEEEGTSAGEQDKAEGA